MAAKRFTITGNRGISDHQKKRLYDLSDFDGMISVTECLNELHEEKEELKARKYPIPIEEMDKYLKYGDIKDLQYANEVIERQRKEIRKLHEENQELRKDVIYWRHKALNEEPVNCRCQMEDLE